VNLFVNVQNKNQAVVCRASW